MYRNIALTASQIICLRELVLDSKRKAIKEGEAKRAMIMYDLLRALGGSNNE